MDPEDLRIFACGVIQNAGILLNLPQVALATAQMLLHRVYNAADFTFKEHPIDITAMAAIFLASKVEEYPRKAREVIDVVTHIISKEIKREIILQYSDHDKIKDEMFDCEKRILKHSGFDLLSKYPHKILIIIYPAVVRTLDPDKNVWTEENSKRIIQLAWNYCNDSMRSDVFTRFSTEAVACACIHMSLRDNKLLFPKSSRGQQWYCLFVENGSDVLGSIDVIEKLYKRPKINYKLMEPYIRLSRY